MPQLVLEDVVQLGVQVYLVSKDSTVPSITLLLALAFSAVNILRIALQAFYSCMGEQDDEKGASKPADPNASLGSKNLSGPPPKAAEQV